MKKPQLSKKQTIALMEFLGSWRWRTIQTCIRIEIWPDQQGIGKYLRKYSMPNGDYVRGRLNQNIFFVKEFKIGSVKWEK
jgi:hypothetical protein